MLEQYSRIRMDAKREALDALAKKTPILSPVYTKLAVNILRMDPA